MVAVVVSNIFDIFSPPFWGHDPIRRAYFSIGLVQPPARKAFLHGPCQGSMCRVQAVNSEHLSTVGPIGFKFCTSCEILFGFGLDKILISTLQLLATLATFGVCIKICILTTPLDCLLALIGSNHKTARPWNGHHNMDTKTSLWVHAILS